MKIKVAPKGMGMNDFVALEEGFFQAEGLDVEIDWKTFRGTQSSWKGMQYFERPQDKAVAEQVIQCLPVGNHQQCKRRHGPHRSRLLWNLPVVDFCAARFEYPPT